MSSQAGEHLWPQAVAAQAAVSVSVAQKLPAAAVRELQVPLREGEVLQLHGLWPFPPGRICNASCISALCTCYTCL